MESQVLILEHKQQVGGFKVIKNNQIVESLNNLNQMFHFIDLTYIEAQIFYQGWVGFHKQQQLKSVLEGPLSDYYKKNNCTRMLIDGSRMNGNYNDMIEWLSNIHFPYLKSQGLNEVSFVLPYDILAQMSIKDLGKQVKSVNFTTHFSLSDAINTLILK